MWVRYAEACSAGDAQSARRVLWEINPAESVASSAPAANVVVGQLAAQLRDRGFEVETNVGQSGFRCDLAVRMRGDRCYRLGIMVDTDSHYQNANILERDLLRPRLLRNFGWTIVPILTKDWFEDANAVMQSLEQRLAIGPAVSF
jgi:very-short-patch-repair endonuclease